MKILAALILFGMTATAHAATTACVPEERQIATILVAAAEELADLKKAAISMALNVTCENIEQGVVRYDFSFRTCGMCLPKSAVLSVQQDLRPTFVDGAPKYEKTLTYGK